MIPNNLELTTKFKEAYAIMNESIDSIFITGKASAGKSTLLLCFNNILRKIMSYLILQVLRH